MIIVQPTGVVNQKTQVFYKLATSLFYSGFSRSGVRGFVARRGYILSGNEIPNMRIPFSTTTAVARVRANRAARTVGGAVRILLSK